MRCTHKRSLQAEETSWKRVILNVYMYGPYKTLYVRHKGSCMLLEYNCQQHRWRVSNATQPTAPLCIHRPSLRYSMLYEAAPHPAASPRPRQPARAQVSAVPAPRLDRGGVGGRGEGRASANGRD